MGFGIWDLGFKGSGFNFWGLGLGASRVDVELEGDVSGFGFRVSGFGFRGSGFGFRVRVSGFKFRELGWTSRVEGKCDGHVGLRDRPRGLVLGIVAVFVTARGFQGLGFRFPGLGFGVSGFRIRASEFWAREHVVSKNSNKHETPTLNP